MIIVTASVDGRRSGCLVGFHSQCGIDPEKYCVWVSKANHTYEIATNATHLGVHFLSKDHLAIARHFGSLTGDEVDKFEGVPYEIESGGAPVLVKLPHRMLLRVQSVHVDDSDHAAIVGEVVELHQGKDFEPLRLSSALSIDAGHPATESG